jgi:hypothetical protein
MRVVHPVAQTLAAGPWTRGFITRLHDHARRRRPHAALSLPGFCTDRARRDGGRREPVKVLRKHRRLTQAGRQPGLRG